MADRTGTMQDAIRAQIEASIATKQAVLKSLGGDIEKSARVLIDALRGGRKVLFFGNGGSAADAQHLAAELVGRYERERRALPAIALTTDTSALTAISNDYTFAKVFARQIEGLGVKGDVAVGITTSGNSENVIQAVLTAKRLGLATIVLAGRDGGKIKGTADLTLVVPSETTSRIQECHIMIGHIWCSLVDRSIAS